MTLQVLLSAKSALTDTASESLSFPRRVGPAYIRSGRSIRFIGEHCLEVRHREQPVGKSIGAIGNWVIKKIKKRKMVLGKSPLPH